MTALSLEQLRERGDAFNTEISREYYLALSGQKASAELQPIYAKHADVMGRDALELTIEAFRAASEGSEEQRAARLLVDWEADAAELAGARRPRRTTDHVGGVGRRAVGRWRQIPFEKASIEMANSSDRDERQAIEKARSTLVARELAPIRRERFQRERDITEELGLAANYNATFELLSGVSLAGLRAECEQFLRETQAMWDEVFPEFIRKELGIEPNVATRSDASALFRAKELDQYFPASAMEETIRRQVRSMGIDPTASGRVTFDTGDREGKRSRAFCSPVRVPDEVYLVLRPHGGQTDWMTFLHELGHALHYAYMRPDLVVRVSLAGRQLDHRRVCDVVRSSYEGHRRGSSDTRSSDHREPRAYLRKTGFEELHYLRRYCAKLIYEMELYGGGVPWDSLPDLYVDRLTTATTFQYNPSDAFVDVDPRYYAARYLRAWQLQALLEETLVERYDVDWWRNPRAGPWICSALFGEGQRELAHEQARARGGQGVVVRAAHPIGRANAGVGTNCHPDGCEATGGPAFRATVGTTSTT